MAVRGVFVEFFEMQRLQRLWMAHRLQVRARGLGALDDEVIEPACDREGVGRQAAFRADRTQRHRNQVEAARHEIKPGAM